MSAENPLATAETEHYWDAARRSELAYQHCADCRVAQFPPRSLCAVCGSDQPDWRVSAGYGIVDSFTIVHRAPNAEFRAKAPYVIALIQLEEGFRMMVNILGASAIETRVGQRVRIAFETRADGVVLPQAELIL